MRTEEPFELTIRLRETEVRHLAGCDFGIGGCMECAMTIQRARQKVTKQRFQPRARQLMQQGGRSQ